MKTTMQITLGAIALFGAACGGDHYETMYGITTAHKDDGQGTLLEVSASFPKDTLSTFHDEERSGAGHKDFDGFTRTESVFEHAGLGYNAHGHGPPGVNDIPHVDAHFYMITTEEREAIDCDGEPVPEAAQIPDGVEVNVNAEPFGGCVKAMGGHGGVPYDKLTANMIYGYHDGKLIFVEPMVDIAMLFAEEEIELEVQRPDTISYQGAYPSRLTVRYTDDTIDFVLGGFSWGD
jgi:hypothetical protein